MADDLSLALPFDSDDPQFRRGVEIGILWSGIKHTGCAEATVHADCAEMVIRIAEAKGLRFTAEAIDETWLHVTIGGSNHA
jgi:hypothetical protein